MSKLLVDPRKRLSSGTCRALSPKIIIIIEVKNFDAMKCKPKVHEDSCEIVTRILIKYYPNKCHHIIANTHAEHFIKIIGGNSPQNLCYN